VRTLLSSQRQPCPWIAALSPNEKICLIPWHFQECSLRPASSSHKLIQGVNSSPQAISQIILSRSPQIRGCSVASHRRSHYQNRRVALRWRRMKRVPTALVKEWTHHCLHLCTAVNSVKRNSGRSAGKLERNCRMNEQTLKMGHASMAGSLPACPHYKFWGTGEALQIMRQNTGGRKGLVIF
jgi:hypothetical protein